MQKTFLTILLFSATLAAHAAPPRGSTTQGSLYGGQQPIGGSQLYLLEPGMPSTTGTVSKSILNNVLGVTTADGNGNYYLTTATTTGKWSATGAYTCDANQPIYAYATGGNPTGGSPSVENNTAIGLLAFIGICPATGGALAASGTFTINEVTTIAVAYAIAGYATDAWHISYDGTTAGLVGVVNAFNNVNNLVNQSTGSALTNTPSSTAAATISVPQSTIYTLGNLLSTCVNASASTSPGCQSLFEYATSDGTAAGAQPSDTAWAAINIAHHPAAQVTHLFNLIPGTVPFVPYLATAPNDFTISFTYSSPSSIGDPWAIAIDGSGNAWVLSVATGTTSNPVAGGSIAEISAAGTFLSPSGGYAASTFQGDTPAAIAIDTANNAWITTASSVYHLTPAGVLETYLSSDVLPSGCSTGVASDYFDGASGIAFDSDGNAWIPGINVFKLSSTGANLSGCGYSIPYGDDSYLLGVAIDGSDNVWIANYYASTVIPGVIELASNGTTLNTFADSQFSSPNMLAVDSQNNVWVSNYTSSGVTEISGSLGRIVSTPNTGDTGGGLSNNAGVAVDGAGNAWFTPNAQNDIGAVELSSVGVPISGTHGYATGPTTTSLNNHLWSAIDGSGNVWIANTTADTVTEIVGAATPLLTPLAAANANRSVGAKP
jgi:hypothetical protein